MDPKRLWEVGSSVSTCDEHVGADETSVMLAFVGTTSASSSVSFFGSASHGTLSGITGGGACSSSAAFAGDGRDELDAEGGAGADLFVLDEPGTTVPTIGDFDGASDRLELRYEAAPDEPEPVVTLDHAEDGATVIRLDGEAVGRLLAGGPLEQTPACGARGTVSTRLYGTPDALPEGRG